VLVGAATPVKSP